MPYDGVEARYRTTFIAASMCFADGQDWYSESNETIVVISGLVCMDNQFKEPMSSWYLLVSGA